MKKQILAIAAACLALLAVSCKQDVPVDTLTVSSEKTINAKWQGATADIVFTTNADWEIICAPNYGDAFLSVEEKEGEAGAVTVKLTISENPKYEARLGTVVILAGSLEEKITVNQDARGTTSEDKTETFNFLAHEFTLSLSERPASVTLQGDAQGWVTAEPDFGKVDFTITENTGAKRTGHVDILVGKHTIHLAIEQEAESGELKNASAIYYGNRFGFYDTTIWGGYSTFKQYELCFESEYGEIVLVVNAGAEAEPTVVPTGNFLIDADATFKPNTFTVAGNPVVTYYTLNGEEITVVDGQIDITKSGSDYEVTAALLSDQNVTKTYTYKGAIEVVKNDSFDGFIEKGNATYGNASTFFTGKVWEWTVTLFYTADPALKDFTNFPSYVTYKLYTAADSDITEFPTGEFKYEVPETDETVTYPNGKLKPNVGTFTFSGNDIPQNPLRINTDKVVPTLTVTKTEDGMYTFALKSNVTMWKWNSDYTAEIDVTEPFDWNPEVTVEAPTVSAGMMGQADGDAVLDTPPSYNTLYSHMWYADAWKNGTNAFVFNMTYINDYFNVYLTLCSGTVWEAYNATAPIPAGTYTFSNSTTTAAWTLVPTALYSYIQNTYTGTKYLINGGSITLTDTDIEYNLTGKSADGKTAKFTGKYNTSVNRCVNRSAEKYAAQMNVTPVE